MNRLEIVVPATPEDVDRFAGLLEEFAHTHDLPARAAMALSLSLHEHLTNIVSHGYPTEGRHEIRVQIEHSPGAVIVEVSDDARPYNPLERPEVDTSIPIDERPIGGLGVHFMRRLMDDLSYRREGGRNVLRLEKRL